MQETIGEKVMSIADDIDRIILYQLKLHWTTIEDLIQHVADKLITKYPDADFTLYGIKARLESLQEELQIEKTQMCNRPVKF